MYFKIFIQHINKKSVKKRKHQYSIKIVNSQIKHKTQNVNQNNLKTFWWTACA